MKRGSSSIGVYITSIKQKMLEGEAWDLFFLLILKNKTELIRVLVEHYKSIDTCKKTSFSAYINSRNEDMENNE